MQTVHSDEWRPGFAKRADNFSEVCAAAETWRWSAGETIARVAAAVLKGTPALSTPQRMTLLLYVEHLNQDRLEQDIACVWPSTGLVAQYLGCSESQARANRKALEAAGFMVRDYTRANRPAGVEAYDLRPLMGRLEELEAVDEAIREAIAARRAAYSETIAFPTKYSAQAPESRRLEQSQKNFKSSVRETDAAPPQHNPEVRPATQTENGKANTSSTYHQSTRQDPAHSSPGGASGSDSTHSAPSVYAEMVRQELRTAAQLCPRLAPLVTPALLVNPTDATPEDMARVATAAEKFLPQPERNNGQTALWGWRKHGIRVLVMLAIVLEDRDIRSPGGYFGKLTGQDRGAADLRLNLARILRAKGDVPPPEVGPAPSHNPAEGEAQAARLEEDLAALPGAEDPKWQAIAAALRRNIREGKFGSWFSRVGFHGVVDGVLTLSTPTNIAAERIKSEFIPHLLDAAAEADVFVDRVVVMLRRK